MTEITQADIDRLATEVMGWHSPKGLGARQDYREPDETIVMHKHEWQPHKDLNQAYMLVDNLEDFDVTVAIYNVQECTRISIHPAMQLHQSFHNKMLKMSTVEGTNPEDIALAICLAILGTLK